MVLGMAIGLARVYRPSKVSELDQALVREFFGRVLDSGKVAQAYLFSGPKGTGKTSAARILAAVLNCEKNEVQKPKDSKKQKLSEPCGKCDNCVSIKAGSSSMVVEIDAASNRGIDDVRVLRDRINLMPSGGSYSVYIVDEVHMLTTEAFNALLKTLEEPPEHVVFCLCTTEEHKLPGTVISRCTKVGYKKATSEELMRSFERVLKGEGVEIEKSVLEEIARKSDGSFRDGVKVLEQLLGSGDEITLERVAKEIGGSSGVELEEFLNLILSADAKGGLEYLDGLMERGVRAKPFMESLIDLASVRLKKGVVENGTVDVKLVDLIEIFSKAFLRFGDVPIEDLAVEMAVVEYCLKYGDMEVREVLNVREVQEVQKVREAEKPKSAKETANAKAERDEQKLDEKEGKKKLKKRVNAEEIKEKPAEVVSKASSQESGEVVLVMEEVRQKWGKVLSALQEHNHGLTTILGRVELSGCDGNVIELCVRYKFHKEQLEQNRYLSLIEDSLAGVFGGKVGVNISVNKKARVPKSLERHDNVTAEVSSEDEKLMSVAEEVFGE